jgi:hypothetical protein
MYPARRATPQERAFSTAWYSSIRCHSSRWKTTVVARRSAVVAMPRPRASGSSQ